jgi:maleylpyruvate isomerase
MRPDAAIATCVRAHEALLAALVPLQDAEFQAASLLPRYSRAHVVTHLANKARAHVWVLGGPAVGEVRRLHPAGYDADRAADLGADRPAAALRADLAQSVEQLEEAWDRVASADWDRLGVMTAGPRTMTEIVSHHMRNVFVHHVDLDIGYQPRDWPSQFVEGELSKRARALPDRTDHAELLAWLLGRSPAPELRGPW